MQGDDALRIRTENIIKNMKEWLETKFQNGIPATNYEPNAVALRLTGNCSICKKNLYSLWKKEKFEKMEESHKSVYLQDGIEKLGPKHMEYAKAQAKISDPTGGSFKFFPLFAYRGGPMNNVKAKASGGRKRRRSRRKSRRGGKKRKSRRKRRKSRKKRKSRRRRRR